MKRSRGELLIRIGLPAAVCALGLVLVLRAGWYREYRLGRMREPELRAWTERRPDDALAHFYLGMARGRAGDEVEAAGQLGKALDLDPTLTRARWRLARLLAAAGQESAAEGLLQRGLQLDPAADRLHAELGRLYERRREFRRASAAWTKAAALAPGDAEVWYHLGRCWMDLNEEALALKPFRRAADLAPQSATYQKALAGALRLNRQYGEAERRCRRALALAPGDPDAQLEMAKLLWDRDGATAPAEATMRRALALQPESPLLHYSMAALSQQRGELEAAAQEYRATLRLLQAHEPPVATADWAEREPWLSQMEGPLLNLARVLRRLGRPGEAGRYLAWFRRISDYRNHARQLLVRIANRPGDAALHFELARLHAAAGSPRLAEEQYRAGLRLRPDAGAQAELRALLRR